MERGKSHSCAFLKQDQIIYRLYLLVNDGLLYTSCYVGVMLVVFANEKVLLSGRSSQIEINCQKLQPNLVTVVQLLVPSLAKEAKVEHTQYTRHSCCHWGKVLLHKSVHRLLYMPKDN